MLHLLFGILAFGGDLVVDAKVPARVTIDGQVVTDLYIPAKLVIPVEDGVRQVIVTTNGDPEVFQVAIGPTPALLLVGRTGTTIGEAAPVKVLLGDANVRFRSADGIRLMIQIDNQRIVVPPGEGIELPLSAGDHVMKVRTPDGLRIFATGTLVVSGGDDLVVQISEGTLPETSGEGVSFQPVSR